MLHSLLPAPLTVEADDGGLYTVTLYPDKAEVRVVKTNRRTGEKHLQALKHNSAGFRRILRTMARRAQPGSSVAEALAECADTRR